VLILSITLDILLNSGLAYFAITYILCASRQIAAINILQKDFFTYLSNKEV